MTNIPQLPITGIIMKLQRQAAEEAGMLLKDKTELPTGELMALLELLRICGIDDEMIFHDFRALSAIDLGHIRSGTSSYSPTQNYKLATSLFAILRERGIQFYDGNQYDQAA